MTLNRLISMCVVFVAVAWGMPEAFAASTSSQAPRILFLGDSLTAGYGISKVNAYPELVKKELAESFPGLEIQNGSVSGSTSSGSDRRLKFFLRKKPTVMVLALGANDGLRGMKTENTYKNLSKTIELALQHNITVVLAGMQLPPNYGFKYQKAFADIFPRLAQEYDLILIPFLLKDVAGKASLNLSDRIHPNEKGHQIMAQTVKPFIETALKKSTQKNNDN